MPKIKIDAVAVSSSDMAKTLDFYRCLGFDFPTDAASQDHVEPITAPGEVRLMIDTAKLMESIIAEPPRPANHSGFALLCDSPAEVDAIAQKVVDAGFEVANPPWDAFWGQRYAIVKDPDGYKIDVFAAL
ncbi:VOC family protein [Aestuariibius sp. HNIBRBA575]|uniref:VOC family protein n=1 Tax=Aestuariibius sp. HNIBRBA575 TaxID=3233343 RepID=UPI0034A263CC